MQRGTGIYLNRLRLCSCISHNDRDPARTDFCGHWVAISPESAAKPALDDVSPMMRPGKGCRLMPVSAAGQLRHSHLTIDGVAPARYDHRLPSRAGEVVERRGPAAAACRRSELPLPRDTSAHGPNQTGMTYLTGCTPVKRPARPGFQF
jgi:hypothetical protein